MITEKDRKKIIAGLSVDRNFATPTDITLKDGILRYNPNCNPRDAYLGTMALEEDGLNVAYDGDPATSECGIDYDTDPHTVVIMVRENLFK